MNNLSNLDLHLLRTQAREYDFLIDKEGQLLDKDGDGTNIFIGKNATIYIASIKNSRVKFEILNNTKLDTLFTNVMVKMFGLYIAKVNLNLTNIAAKVAV